MDAAIDALYALAPEEFVAARDALARERRAEGDRDAAGEIRKLRRPSVAAWAVNQLARRHPDDIRALQQAGADLRQAQRRALSGVRGDPLRDAVARRRVIVDRLTDEGERILTEAGRGSAEQRRDIAATLEAASIDEDAGALVAAGRLDKPLRAPTGFAAVTGLSLVPPMPQMQPETEREAEPGETRAGAGGNDEALREARRALEESSERARTAAARARRAEQQASEEERRAGEVERDARRLEREAAARRREADQAAERARRAQAAATRARDHVAAAEAERSEAEAFVRALERG